MIHRRHAMRLLWSALPAVCLLRASAARAEEEFQRFIPYLIELDGWKGNKPDGMSMQAAGTSMNTASRDYHRDPARFSASVMTGTPAQSALAAMSAMGQIQTSDARLGTSTINGMQVTQTYTISNKSGTILVALGRSALLSFAFSGITDEEALKLAQKFDWKTIQAVALK